MKRILFIIDDINCCGGAHVATRLMLQRLVADGKDVSVLSSTMPSDTMRRQMDGIKFIVFEVRFHSIRWWIRWFYVRFLKTRLFSAWWYDYDGKILKTMCAYDVVCICSEISEFRLLMLKLPASVRKVHLVHTNYDGWLKYDRCARMCVKEDDLIYPYMDVIGVVGAVGAGQFEHRFIKCKGHVFPFYNLIDRSLLKYHEKHTSRPVHLLSLLRMDDDGAKDGYRMIRVASVLKASGIDFDWTVYGTCERRSEFEREIDHLGVRKEFIIAGYEPQARKQISRFDLLVVLSHYEGLPNVIYESLLSGTPVFATNVGGISEQVVAGKTGWLVVDDEKAIIEKLKQVVAEPEEIVAINRLLSSYKYDSNDVFDKFKSLLIV